VSRPWIGAGVVFALALAIYTLSLAPGVFSWDSAELTLGIYTQGIVHATGYPLYLILGRLFTLLPLSDDFAVRANLFSAVCGALTVALLYLICLRLIQHPLLAAGSALLYGLARAIWAQAVVAEVYTLHTALMAGILLLIVVRDQDNEARRHEEKFSPQRHREHRGDPYPSFPAPLVGLVFRQPDVLTSGGAPRKFPEVRGIGILLGLALANHMAALLVAAVLLPYLLWKTFCWRARAIMIAITGFTAALLYLYLPTRFAAQPDFNLVAQYFDRDLTQPADLLWMVSGRMFGQEMLAYPLLDWIGEIGKFFGELWLNYLGGGVLLGILGIRYLWRRNRTLCLLLNAVFAVQVLFFTSYDVFDKWTMFHTAYLVWAIFVAAGCRTLLDILPPIPVYLFLAVLVGAQFFGNWNVSGRAGDTFVADRTAELLAALPPDATLIGPWTALRPIEYQQIVNRQRRDVSLVDVTLLTLGERDRLGGEDSDALDEAVDRRLRAVVACAPAAVYVVDPAILDVDVYEVAFVQTGLYRITARPESGC